MSGRDPILRRGLRTGGDRSRQPRRPDLPQRQTDPRPACSCAFVLASAALSRPTFLVIAAEAARRHRRDRPVVGKLPGLTWVARGPIYELMTALTVWFDGGCPLCRREIALMRRLDRRRAIRFVDLATGRDPARWTARISWPVSMPARTESCCRERRRSPRCGGPSRFCGRSAWPPETGACSPRLSGSTSAFSGFGRPYKLWFGATTALGAALDARPGRASTGAAVGRRAGDRLRDRKRTSTRPFWLSTAAGPDPLGGRIGRIVPTSRALALADLAPGRAPPLAGRRLQLRGSATLSLVRASPELHGGPGERAAQVPGGREGLASPF